MHSITSMIQPNTSVMNPLYNKKPVLNKMFYHTGTLCTKAMFMKHEITTNFKCISKWSMLTILLTYPTRQYFFLISMFTCFESVKGISHWADLDWLWVLLFHIWQCYRIVWISKNLRKHTFLKINAGFFLIV